MREYSHFLPCCKSDANCECERTELRRCGLSYNQRSILVPTQRRQCNKLLSCRHIVVMIIGYAWVSTEGWTMLSMQHCWQLVLSGCSPRRSAVLRWIDLR